MIGLRTLGIVEDHEAMKLVFVASLKVKSFISLISAPAKYRQACEQGDLMILQIVMMRTCKSLLATSEDYGGYAIVIVEALESIVQFHEKRCREGVQSSRTIECN